MELIWWPGCPLGPHTTTNTHQWKAGQEQSVGPRQGGVGRGRDMCTPAVDTRYWDSCRQTRGESTSVQGHKHRHVT